MGHGEESERTPLLLPAQGSELSPYKTALRWETTALIDTDMASIKTVFSQDKTILLQYNISFFTQSAPSTMYVQYRTFL